MNACLDVLAIKMFRYVNDKKILLIENVLFFWGFIVSLF